MNIKKISVQIIVVVMASVLALSCSKTEKQEGWDVTIRGKVGYPQPGEISIQKLSRDESAQNDTIKLKGNYTYEKTLRIKEPGYYQINFYNKQLLNFILDKSDLEINVDGNNQNGFAEVVGSPDQNLITDVQNLMNRVQNSADMTRIQTEFSQASSMNDQARIAQLQSDYMRNLDKGYDEVAELLRSQPVSLGLMNLLQQNNLLDKDKYFDLYVSSAEKFKEAWPSSTYTKEFTDMVEKMKVTAIGQPAPEIALPNPDGQTIALSSLRGKYVSGRFLGKVVWALSQRKPECGEGLS